MDVLKLAEAGDAEAQYQIGFFYDIGDTDEFPQSYEKAVEWYSKAAELGHPQAQSELGRCYAEALGVSQDDELALRWYRKAAEQDDVNAQVMVGVFNLKGRGMDRPSFDEAALWFQKAADNGDAEAQRRLAFLYLEGKGVAGDRLQAIQLFERAAANGDDIALVHLGDMVLDESPLKSGDCYEKAASLGNRLAQYKLGLLYQSGRGREKDVSEALRIFLELEQGGVDYSGLWSFGELLSHIHKCYESLGNTEEAAYYLEEASHFSPK
ncbi:Sel1 repeat protein [Polychytrium aggregatum]|uniref:Sel1 repeat protein n=1 Tax=Polychytrium aggregatum TaxID=110093 RepID=UPI0022FEDC37|nr:Sel1 repeat protein [Polychytrium aggregatum]KAI9209356.1 Sel1 repeat protein [Polychytrium aggregatum]